MFVNRVVVPQSLRSKVLLELHVGHQGIVKTKALARLHVYWPALNDDIERMIQGCPRCQQWAHMPKAATQIPSPWPQEPWTQLHLDLAGPLMKEMLLIISDQTPNGWMLKSSNARIQNPSFKHSGRCLRR
jgi:hypothetical protein